MTIPDTTPEALRALAEQLRDPEKMRRWWDQYGVPSPRSIEAAAALLACAEERERLDWLIQQAYSGPNDDLREPHAVGLVIGGKVEWPDGVRGAIDAARAQGEKP